MSRFEGFCIRSWMILILLPSVLIAADQNTFNTKVHPFMQTHCLSCHNREDSDGGVNLEQIRTHRDFETHPTLLTHLLFVLEEGDMPPPEADSHPKPDEVDPVLAWLEAELNRQRNASPNDPGLVTAARLTADEYGNVIRDLFHTSVPDASAFLMPEGGAGEGFDNVGEAQSLTAQHFEAYLNAARRVLFHATFSPRTGANWTRVPRPEAQTDDAMLKLLREEWVSWMSRGVVWVRDHHFPELREQTGLTWGAYPERAWMYENRQRLGLPWNDLTDAARGLEPTLIPNVLNNFYELLSTGNGGGRGGRQLADRWANVSPDLPLPRVREAFQEIEAEFHNRGGRELQEWTKNLGQHARANAIGAFYGLEWVDETVRQALDLDYINRKQIPGLRQFRMMPQEVIARVPEDQRREAEMNRKQILDLVYPLPPQEQRQAARELLTSVSARAWSRPPQSWEINNLTKLYDHTREQELSYDFAVKTALRAILVSPDFLYRFQTARKLDQPYPIADVDIARRLSFFIWASLPDDELLHAARAGRLQDSVELRRQTGRMLRDPRAAALATRFAGQWLGFSEFETFSGPDSERFPEFTPSLRKAMYEETRLFFQDLLIKNQPLTWLIRAPHSYLNEELATHYGISGVKGSHMRKVTLPDARRGGLLTMGSILTKTSAPLRTSPVHRGVWVYENLLGFDLSPPPPVPLLSDDEQSEDGLTIAEQLREHRENPSCFACHARFDAYGFGLENFDPIGRWRTQDGGGAPVVSRETLRDGSIIEGLDGLRRTLDENMDRIALTFSRKLTGYALGRGILLTDRPLLEEMTRALRENQYRPHAALAVLLDSPQFRQRRDGES